VDGLELDNFRADKAPGCECTVKLMDVSDFNLHNSPDLPDVQSNYEEEAFF